MGKGKLGLRHIHATRLAEAMADEIAAFKSTVELDV
jgi:hypothetical protein